MYHFLLGAKYQTFTILITNVAVSRVQEWGFCDIKIWQLCFFKKLANFVPPKKNTYEKICQEKKKNTKERGLFYFSISKKQFKFNFPMLLILLTDCRTRGAAAPRLPSARRMPSSPQQRAIERATRNLPRNNQRVSDRASDEKSSPQQPASERRAIFPATTSEWATSNLPRSSHPATQRASGLSRN